VKRLTDQTAATRAIDLPLPERTQTGAPLDVRWSDDGSRILVVTYATSKGPAHAQAYDANTGATIGVKREFPQIVVASAFAADGALAAASGTNLVQLWRIDDGSPIAVSIRPSGDRLTIDFTGSAPVHSHGFNAPLAVTMAAVLYVFRTLVDDEIPMNAGCLKPITVIVPEGTMLNPRHPAAVVAGNVETSMCITNCLYGALGVMASGPPTMNNFTFGNALHQYYETISGGSGAGGMFDTAGRLVGGFDGTAVVQTHMTNSRLTDPEVLETRFPVRLESYEIRPGSGGAGRWRGGDGGVRRIRFLEPMTASILSNGRIYPAFGAAGGHPGAPGRNSVVRSDGRVQELAHADRAELGAGDQFVIETPGGGGFGEPG
jgi:5-oxoprolinase (ATP-hydrolysing)